MSKLTDLTEVTTLADGDLGMVVDVSNTSMDATGTNSKVTLSNVYAYIKTKTDLLYASVLGADDNYVTDAEKIVIGNTSGTNTGDNATNTSSANTALSNLASVAINTSLVSDTDNTDDLGTTLKKWANLFVTNIGSTAVRVTQGWFTDLTVTNAILGSMKAATTSSGILMQNNNGVTVASFGVGAADSTNIALSGNVAVGTNNITMTGSLAATAARILKGWFTDIESTNMPTVGGTAILSSLTAPQFTTVELGHASDTTLSRVSAGVIAVEGVNVLTTAGGTLTGSITLGENTGVALDPAGSADGKWSGITIAGTAGYTQAFGDLVYLAVADSRWELADADVEATGGYVMLGMVVSAGTDGTACTILLQGQIRADAKFPALTVGKQVFVGETAGAIQVAIPTGADNVIRSVGFALTADEIYFNPSQDYQLSVA